MSSIVFMDADGNLDFDNEIAVEFDKANAEALANCPFGIGDRVKLNSQCPKDTRDSCRVRIGDVGTLLDVTAWPVNDGVVVQMGVRWDHEEDDDPVFLGIFEEHLENE